MTAEIAFAVATADDLARILDMKLAMFEEAGHASLLSPGAATNVLADYRDLYSQGLARHFIAKASGKIVASTGAFLKSDLPFRYFGSAQYGFIGDVYTEPDYRGKGIAKALNEQALAWFRGQGVTMVRLLASEAGRPMYEKLGFKASDEMVLKYAI